MIHTAHLIVTCEHGGNLIPPAWRGLFTRHTKPLLSHQGFDAGALTLARDIAQALDAKLFYSKTSRLLVDLNRSIGHPQLFSAITRKLAPAAREKILTLQYRPYRKEIESHVREAIEAGKCAIHIASHSFSPELKGKVRDVDVGLLYDPSRAGEVALAGAWQARLSHHAPALAVRRNSPYKGTSDGLTAFLRKQFGPENYVGLELEVNQKHVFAKNRHWPRLRHAVVKSLAEALDATFGRQPPGE